MIQYYSYTSPTVRLVSMSLEKHCCSGSGNNSQFESGSTHGGPEDVGYDNWLDGLE